MRAAVSALRAGAGAPPSDMRAAHDALVAPGWLTGALQKDVAEFLAFGTDWLDPRSSRSTSIRLSLQMNPYSSGD